MKYYQLAVNLGCLHFASKFNPNDLIKKELRKNDQKN